MFKRSDLLVLIILLSAGVSWAFIGSVSPPTLTVHAWQRPVVKTAVHPAGALDLNRASYEELLAVPGIGPVLAQRIIDYRQEHGLFKTIDELDNVKGIGPKTLAKLRPYLHVGH